MRTLPTFLLLTILVTLAAPCLSQEVVSTIAFTSTRDNPTAVPIIEGGEIYFIDVLDDGSYSPARRLTQNTHADTFPALSPDGKGKIVFTSTRRRTAGEPANTSDLFLMNDQGEEQVFLTRGASATWDPRNRGNAASKTIAFQASASGTGLPVLPTPGAATRDSDIFVVNVHDLLEKGAQPVNITNHPNIDDDPDWSPDGAKIAFTSHRADDIHTNATSTEIYVMNPDGTDRQQLTFNLEEERGPDWSPDGTMIVYMCRRGDFEICVMNADGTGVTQLTDNTVADFTPSWSPDGQKILFHRPLGPGVGNQLFVMNANGTAQTQLTVPPGQNLLASWGVIKDSGKKE